MRRCSFQASGKRVSSMSLRAVSSGGCFPLRIALTISGASSVRRNSRVAYGGTIRSDLAISFGNFLQCQSLVPEEPILNHKGTNEDTYQAGIRLVPFVVVLDSAA